MIRFSTKPVSTLIQLTWLFAFVVHPAPELDAQHLDYYVYLNGKSVGSLKADRNARDGLAHYLIESRADFRFVFKISTDYTFETTYQNGMLTKASTKNVVNDEVRGTSKVTWNGTHYLVETKEERSVLKSARITYSMVSLYFTEPKLIRQVFSERYAKFLPIRSVGEHRYELDLPDGKKNYYTYANGFCQLVEAGHRLGKITFKLTGVK